jgi:hypothetical protein
MPQFVASLNDDYDSRGVINNRNMFIIQATDMEGFLRMLHMGKLKHWT